MFVRGCRGEAGAEDRGEQGRAFEVGLCLSGDVGERLVRRTVARRAERFWADFVCPGMSGRDWCGGPWRAGPSVSGRTLFVRGCRGETGAEDGGAQGRAFEVGLCLSGDVGERPVRRTVARRAARSRSDFVCPGMSGRDWCGGPWRAGLSVRGRTLFVRVCRGEAGAEDRGGQGQALEVGLCLSGNVGERLVRKTVAGRAERSRSDFVCPGMSGRDWCGGPWRAGPNVRGRTLFVRGVLTSQGMQRFLRDFCVNVAQTWRETSSILSSSDNMTKERIGKIFYEKMSGKGVEADLSGQGKNAQKSPLSNKTSEQREDHLAAERKRAAVKRSNETTVQRKERIAAERKWAAVKRSNETSEQREERLAAQRKRAAAKVFNESSKEREERLRAKRERAAVKLTQETSQEKDIRLKVRRERAALKRQGESRPEGVETNRRAQSRRDSDTRRRNQREAIFAAQRNEYFHNRGWADPENHGLHHEEWAQEEMAAFHRFEENLRHYHCVVCKEAWPLSTSREQIFTCSRCKRDTKPCRLYSAENDMDPGSVPAELQGLSEVEELLIARAFPIMSIYRKQ